MESTVLTSCSHIHTLCTQQGLQQVYRAAEWVFSSTYRPILGINKQAVPRCLYPQCLYSATADIYVCLQCIYVACTTAITSATDLSTQTHLSSHYSVTKHTIFLSVEHSHLFCVACDDFVYDRFLDPALELQAHRARACCRLLTSSVSPLDPPIPRALSAARSISKTRNQRRRLVTRTGWTPTEKELATIAKKGLPLSALTASIRPPVGLFNLGNSCYMNSVLQAFLNAPPLRNFFLANEHRPYCSRDIKLDCFACALDQLVCDSCFTVEGSKKSASALDVPFLVPQNVLDIVWRNAEHLATYTQHDAHEFLIAAINLLNAHCRRSSPPKQEYTEPVTTSVKVKKEAELVVKSYTDTKNTLTPVSPVTNLRADERGTFSDAPLRSSASTSIVQNLFSGTLQSDVVCRVCGNSSATLEKFYDISLDVDKLVKPSSTRRSRAQSPVVDGVNEDYPSSAKSSQFAVSGDDRSRAKGRNEDRSDMNDTTQSSSDGHKNSMDFANGSWDIDREKELDPANTLHECLARFTEPELLGSSSKMFCASCATRQEAMKQMSIRTLPPIVCFHFKRFEQSFASIRRSEMVKIDTPVEFPANSLDLSSFQTSAVLRRRSGFKPYSPTKTVETALVATMKKKLKAGDKQRPESDLTPPRETEESVYDLFAVVNHIGKIDSGHYTAMVRREGQWFRCDDEKVSPMKDVDRVIRSEEAYLVFYVQRHPNFQYI